MLCPLGNRWADDRSGITNAAPGRIQHDENRFQSSRSANCCGARLRDHELGAESYWLHIDKGTNFGVSQPVNWYRMSLT